MSDLGDTGLAALAFSRRVLLRLLDGLDASNVLVRLGGTGSHAMHIVGHLATTDEFFRTTLSGEAWGLPPAYRDLFGMGAEPRDDAGAYPPFGEVRGHLDGRRAALVAWFGSLDEAGLLEPLPEMLRGFAANRAVAMSTLAFHEGFHTGQISGIRRQLGLARALG